MSTNTHTSGRASICLWILLAISYLAAFVPVGGGFSADQMVIAQAMVCVGLFAIVPLWVASLLTLRQSK
jgi:hypothetical protein